MRNLICLFLGFFSLLHADTYRGWLAGQPEQAQVQVEFIPAKDAKVEVDCENVYYARGKNNYLYKIPKIPLAGYVGDLRISTRENIKLPLYVLLYTSEVEVKDLNEKESNQEKKEYFWDKKTNLLDLSAKIQSAFYIESHHINQQVGTIPVILVPMKHSNYSYREDVNSYRIEVCDGTGRVIYRDVLFDAFGVGREKFMGSGSLNGLVSDSYKGADRFLRDEIGIKDLRTFRKMPSDIEVYPFQISAIWLSDADLKYGVISTDILRKFILMGGSVYGKDEDITAIKSTLGISSGIQKIGLGNIGNNQKKASDSHDTQDLFQYGEWKIKDHFLFQPLEKRYLFGSVIPIGVFAVIAIILIPLSFFKLNGAKRIYLWSIVPAIALIFTIVAVVVGNVAFPKTVQLKVAEYRIAYQGWGEVLSYGGILSLPLKYERLQFTAPPKTSFKSWSGNLRYIKHVQDDRLMLEVTNFPRGNLFRGRWISFISDTPPVKLVDNTALRFSRPMEQVYVYHGTKVSHIKKVEPGYECKLSDLNGEEKFPSLPFDVGSYPNHVCDSCKNDYASKLQNEVCVVGVVNESPTVKFTGKSDLECKVVWSVQMPLDGGVK